MRAEELNPESTPEAERGFTLIEATVTMAVAAVVLTTAAPGFAGFLEKQRLDGAAARLASDLHFARSEAARRNDRVRLSLHEGAFGTCYVVHTGAAADCVCEATGPAACSGDAEQIKTVVLAAADRVSVQANVGSILFDPLHGTSTPTGTFRVVAASGRAIHHVVNVMGRVRTCSPQGAAAPAVAGYAVC
jgi:type IV fimbrial biogenesis protein FimT